MKRSLLISVATALSLVACTENSPALRAGPFAPLPPPPTTPSTSVLGGRITVSLQGADSVVDLRDVDGDVYRLVGDQTAALASVDGGDVIAFGTWDASLGFAVQEFQVVGMQGRPALDGILEVSEEGFALRLADGSIVLVPGLGPECADFVGERLWVVGWDEGIDVAYGRIA